MKSLAEVDLLKKYHESYNSWKDPYMQGFFARPSRQHLIRKSMGRHSTILLGVRKPLPNTLPHVKIYSAKPPTLSPLTSSKHLSSPKPVSSDEFLTKLRQFRSKVTRPR